MSLDTEVKVQVTLTVDVEDNQETLKSRIKALLESSGQMDVKEIQFQGEVNFCSCLKKRRRK